MNLSVSDLLAALWPSAGGVHSVSPRTAAQAQLWLQSRTRTPQLTSGLLDRTDEWQSLFARYPLLWLNAPAGYGKTRLMTELAATLNDTPVIWLTLDSHDSAPLHFLISLLLSVEQACPGMAADTLELMAHEPEAMPADIWLSHWLGQLAESCVAERQDAFVLMLSDVQVLDSEPAWALLMQLLMERPESVRLVISGRYRPRSLGKTALLPELCQLGSKQLALSDKQQRQWLRQQGVLCDDTGLQRLHERLRGWPAGVAIWLACYRAAGLPLVVSDTLGQREIADFWWTEVVEGTLPSRQSLLQLLAILGEAPEALLDTMLGQPAFDCLQQAVRCQLVEASELEGWYALPAHFQRLASSAASLAERQRRHREACLWYCDQANSVMAMSHARQAEESPELVPWVARHTESILASLDASGTIEWYESSAEDPVSGMPHVVQLACWSYLLTHKDRRASSLLRQLIQRGCLSDDEVAALQGYLARLRGQPRSAMTQCQQAWESLPERRYAVRFLMATTLTYVCLGETDLNAARSWNRHALLLARRHKSIALESMALFDQARIELHRGHIDHSQYLVESGTRILSGLTAAHQRLPMGRLLLYRAFLLWLTNREREQQEPLLALGVDLCRRSNDVLVLYGYGLTAMVLSSRGQYRNALDRIDEAERLMQSWAVDPERYLWMILVKAHIWMSEGKFHRAQGCLDELMGDQALAQLARPEVFPMLPDLAAATQARLYLITRDYDACLAVVDEWLRCNSSPMMMLLIQLIRGAALRGCNQIAESQHLFTQVGQQLQQEGIELDFRTWLPELYTSPGKIQALPGQVERVQLSEREHDVLRKIAEGLSNQEIAAQLFISLHTVKSHARKINVKLGVKNRTQAIHKAKELLLL